MIEQELPSNISPTPDSSKSPVKKGRMSPALKVTFTASLIVSCGLLFAPQEVQLSFLGASFLGLSVVALIAINNKFRESKKNEEYKNWLLRQHPEEDPEDWEIRLQMHNTQNNIAPLSSKSDNPSVAVSLEML